MLPTEFVLEFAISTSPIIHLVCPPKFCITFVSHFSWVLESSQEKLKTMLMQNFEGQTGCIMGDVDMANECTDNTQGKVVSFSNIIIVIIIMIFINLIKSIRHHQLLNQYSWRRNCSHLSWKVIFPVSGIYLELTSK